MFILWKQGIWTVHSNTEPTASSLDVQGVCRQLEAATSEDSYLRLGNSLRQSVVQTSNLQWPARKPTRQQTHSWVFQSQCSSSQDVSTTSQLSQHLEGINSQSSMPTTRFETEERQLTWGLPCTTTTAWTQALDRASRPAPSPLCQSGGCKCGNRQHSQTPGISGDEQRRLVRGMQLHLLPSNPWGFLVVVWHPAPVLGGGRQQRASIWTDRLQACVRRASV